MCAGGAAVNFLIKPLSFHYACRNVHDTSFPFVTLHPRVILLGIQKFERLTCNILFLHGTGKAANAVKKLNHYGDIHYGGDQNV